MQVTSDAEFDPAGLLDPSAYPWPVQSVAFIETHISWLFLTNDRVLKLRRPVQFPFVDHRTLEARAHSCRAEVELNRRLTNGVYLDVVPIVRKDGGYGVGADGEVIEWGTLMRRMPAERMLDRLIADDAVPDGTGKRIGETLRRFHDDIPECATGPDNARVQMAVVSDNLAEIEEVAGDALSPSQRALVRDAVLSFLERNGALFHDRVAGGFVRNGHGDLRTDHICLDDGDLLQIFDCIEFNADLRCADIASDLAFLLTDLRRLDRDDLAADVLEGYGADDRVLPPGLLRLYQTHRALVKVKTECLTIAESEDGAEQHRASAVMFLDTAFQTAIRTRPCVLTMTGLSGTGKSTVARRLAKTVGARWLRTDEIRAEITTSAGGAGGWQEGEFTAEWTERTYEELYQRAAQALAEGVPVVLDGAFLEQNQRQQVADFAAREGVPALLIETTAPESVVRQRLDAREKAGVDPSKATFAIYRRQRDEVARRNLTIPDGMTGITIDTTDVEATMLESVWQALETLDLLGTFVDADSA